MLISMLEGMRGGLGQVESAAVGVFNPLIEQSGRVRPGLPNWNDNKRRGTSSKD